MPQMDPELFDRGQFQAELALKSSPIAAFKKAIKQAREVLDGRFREGRDIRRRDAAGPRPHPGHAIAGIRDDACGQFGCHVFDPTSGPGQPSVATCEGLDPAVRVSWKSGRSL